MQKIYTLSVKAMNILMKKGYAYERCKKAIRYSCEDINSGNISGQGICVAVLDTGECVIILQSSPAKRGELYIH